MKNKIVCISFFLTARVLFVSDGDVKDRQEVAEKTFFDAGLVGTERISPQLDPRKVHGISGVFLSPKNPNGPAIFIDFCLSHVL